MIKWLTIILALAGTGLGFYTIATVGDDAPPRLAPAAPPSVNPFARGIAAGGSVEAISRNVAIGAPETGLVVEVLVQVGQVVRAGEPLFRQDPRLLEADLVQAESSLVVAQAELAQLQALPRAEELPPLEALVRASQARLADMEDRYSDMLAAQRRGGISPTEVARSRFAVEAAKAEVDQAGANLALTKAGAWGLALRVSEAKVKRAEGDVQAVRLRLDRLTIRSPMDATVLKRNVEPGQLAGGAATPADGLMVLGDLRRLVVRARVDEEDAPQLREHARAIARVRGLAPEDLTLRMLRIEPTDGGDNRACGYAGDRGDL
jgi:multidrug efflux pump subunit AcrA (membrane-fusion protein)